MRKERELESVVLCVFDLEGEGYCPNYSVSRRVETHTLTSHSLSRQSEIERETALSAHNNDKRLKKRNLLSNNNHCKIISEISYTLSSPSFPPASLLLLSSVSVNSIFFYSVL